MDVAPWALGRLIILEQRKEQTGTHEEREEGRDEGQGNHDDHLKLDTDSSASAFT